MANRAGTIILRYVGGGAVMAALLTLSFGTFIAVLSRADFAIRLGPSDWAAIKFTVWQALVSAGVSIILAIPVARALARQNFWGRRFLITLLGAPFILPVIVGVLGLLVVFGRSGWISDLLGLMGLGPISIYGAFGVILAHVFFNLPLATRLIVQGWLAVPDEHLRLTATLGAGRWAMFRLIEWPLLLRVVPGAFLLVFLLCLTSFAVALAVGGGPKATTIELAIYQAFRFDFDLGKAAVLAAIQFIFCLGVAMTAFFVPIPRTSDAGFDRVVTRFDASGVRALDTVWISLATVFLVLPLTAIAMRGVPHLLALPSQTFPALGTSLMVALISTALCLAMALILSLAVARSHATAQKLTEGLGVMGLATSPLVVGTGLFIMIWPFAQPMDFALPITALVNAAMALPFAMRAILPSVVDVYAVYGRLGDSLGMTPTAWVRFVVIPRCRSALGFAGGLAAALSMGDLGVIALFADPQLETLPLLLYRLMGAYRMDQAAAVALVLLTCSLALFWIIDKGGRARA